GESRGKGFPVGSRPPTVFAELARNSSDRPARDSQAGCRGRGRSVASPRLELAYPGFRGGAAWQEPRACIETRPEGADSGPAVSVRHGSNECFPANPDGRKGGKEAQDLRGHRWHAGRSKDKSRDHSGSLSCPVQVTRSDLSA